MIFKPQTSSCYGLGIGLGLGRSVIKGQKFDSSKFDKVLSLSRKWAQKKEIGDKHKGLVNNQN